MPHIHITVSDGPTSARVIQFATRMPMRELMQCLAVIRTLISHFGEPAAPSDNSPPAA